MKPSRIVIATIALCLAGPAAAEDRAAAEQFFRLGAEAYRGGKFDVAATNFDSAYENLKAPEIAFSAAQAHRMQYQHDRDPARLVRALELYRAYVAGAPEGGKRKDAQIYIERLDEQLKKIDPAQIVIARPKPSIFVALSPESAQLTIDGKAALPNTPVEVPPGDHVVAASAEGYFPRQAPVRVADAMVSIPFMLVARPATLSIRSQPGARITVDGRPVILRGTSTEVAAGTRWITVSARGRKPVSREVTLAPGQALTLDAPLQPTAQRRAVRWVAVGAGALLAGTITTTVIALAADFSAADLRDRDVLRADQEEAYVEARARRDGYRTASFVLGGAALAAAAIAAVLYYNDEPAPDALLRPVEQKRPDGGFTPIALGEGLGAGLGYAGGF